ncbi:MAG: IS110 family transposase [Acidimicrobiia bacterium]
MASLQARPVVTGGVDTHRDVHVAAVLDGLGRLVATGSFPATPAGYRTLTGWMKSFGTIDTVGVEGTGAWGAGLTRHLTAARVRVIEVTRVNRQRRRRYGKTDTTDAISAAKAVQSGEATGAPRGGTGPVESLRLLRIARRSAMKQRTAVANQLHAVIVTADDTIRAQHQGLPLTRTVTIAANYRPGDLLDPTQAAKWALKTLARRYQHLTEELDTLTSHISSIVTAIAPKGLLDMCGVGPHVAADLLITAGTNPNRLANARSFAALCGTSPVDASSGLQQRHRLNRGGDRQANAALYRITIVRLRWHQPTRNSMTRRLKDGKTKAETIRCLKRYIANEIHHHLTQPPT